MTVGINYPTPVLVNGFLCKDCTDVDYAKKHIDPAHPKSGPYGIDAKDDPSIKNAPSPSVTFGGNLSGLNATQAIAQAQGAALPANGEGASGTVSGAAIGTHLDVSA